MAYRTVNHEFENRVKVLEQFGHKWVGNIYPIAYGEKAPAGFAGIPDEKQQRFNRMVHFSMHPSDASMAEFRNGMVVRIPNDSVWCHWLATGIVPDEFLVNNSDMEIFETFAHFRAVLNAFRCDRAEFHARMMLRNEQVFEEWLEDYAERNGMFVESARFQVMEERANAARSAGSVAGTVTRKAEGTPRHESSYYESHCTPLVGKHDVIDHDWQKSWEWAHKRNKQEVAPVTTAKQVARKSTTKKHTTKRATTRKPAAKKQTAKPQESWSSWNQASLRRAQARRAAGKAHKQEAIEL